MAAEFPKAQDKSDIAAKEAPQDNKYMTNVRRTCFHYPLTKAQAKAFSEFERLKTASFASQSVVTFLVSVDLFLSLRNLP